MQQRLSGKRAQVKFPLFKRAARIFLLFFGFFVRISLIRILLISLLILCFLFGCNRCHQGALTLSGASALVWAATLLLVLSHRDGAPGGRPLEASAGRVRPTQGRVRRRGADAWAFLLGLPLGELRSLASLLRLSLLVKAGVERAEADPRPGVLGSFLPLWSGAYL